MATLKRLLDENPQLIRARSTREHQATLLHYVSANGVEGYRQKTPNNAAKVAEILLQAGAEVDAEAHTAGRLWARRFGPRLTVISTSTMFEQSKRCSTPEQGLKMGHSRGLPSKKGLAPR